MSKASPIAAVVEPAGAVVAVPLWRRPMVLAVLLGLLTVAIYWTATQNDFINYDDDYYVTENPNVKGGLSWNGLRWSLTAMEASNWHPLTWLSHMLDVSLYGLKPWGHHLTNVLFHAANTMLLFGLLRRLTGALWQSALVAALFALHPLHVESVAWVAERKDVLSTFFGLLALICYARYVEQSRARKGESKVSYALALFWFGCGLLSKPMLVTWPCVMLLLDYWPLKRFPIGDWRLAIGKLIREKIPFFCLSMASCVLTWMAQTKGEAIQDFKQFSLGERFANTFVSYTRYFVKIFWPGDLAVPYPHPGAWPGGTVLAAAAFVVVLSGLALWQARRRPYFLIGWLIFLGVLVPVIGLVQVGGQAMADRYMYVPAVGLFVALVWGLFEVAERWRLPKLGLSVVVVAVLGLCAARSHRQIAFWKNSTTLWRHVLAVTKDNESAMNNLAVVLIETNRGGEAERLCQDLLRINPNNADAWNNLGLALDVQKRTNDAIVAFEAALRVKPGQASAAANLGNLLLESGRGAEGLEKLREAVRLDPQLATAHNQLGRALALQNKFDEAVLSYQEALRLNPFDAGVHHNLGLALSSLGKTEPAAESFARSVHLNPESLDARNDYSSALVELGRLNEAVEQCREILRRNPNYARAHDNLGAALASQGKLDEALPHLREAARLAPENAKTRFNLGHVLALRRQYAEAEVVFIEAIRLAPDLLPAQVALADARFQLGLALLQKGNKTDALQYWRGALRVQPNHRESLNSLAWVLATDRDAAVRHGAEAVQLAQQLVRSNATPESFDTLAAAQAENHQFTEAVVTAQKALSLATNSKNEKLAAEIHTHLQSYQAGQPHRE